MGMKKRGKESLLDVIVKERTDRTLDMITAKSEEYRAALKHQNDAYAVLEKAGLSKEQMLLVDDVISATNECGTAYGMAAYRLGLNDGIRLVAEIG